MVDQSRRDRVGLGLIGPGSNWEHDYRETLIGLQNRLTVRLVYDPVEARAKSVAADFDADIAVSLRQVLARPTLQGLLVLDPGWLGAGALNLIARYRKPVYLAFPALRQAAASRDARGSILSSASNAVVASDDDFWFPEFRWRFTPASCRLRELIATKLGRVERIVVHYGVTTDLVELAHLIDWCANLVGHSSGELPLCGCRSCHDEPVELEFPPLPRSSSSRTVRLQPASGQNVPVQFEIRCERGNATLSDRTRIVWNSSTESADELLTDERPETAILIDQFCRRAVGGLIPVGRLSDYFRAIEIAESLTAQR